MAACFVSECDFTNKWTKVQISGTWYTCKPGMKNFTASNGKVYNCPHYGRFCDGVNNCPNECNQRGNCEQGKCDCYEGYRGTDCSQKY